MSEDVPVRGIILGHGSLAEAYADAIRRITGAGDDALLALSNTGLSPDMVAERLRALTGEGPVIIFTDLPGGSCGFAARRLCQTAEHVAVLSGVNLTVLLEFIMHRSEPLAQLVPLLVEKGRAAICCAPPQLERKESNGHRAASG